MDLAKELELSLILDPRFVSWWKHHRSAVDDPLAAIHRLEQAFVAGFEAGVEERRLDVERNRSSTTLLGSVSYRPRTKRTS